MTNKPYFNKFSSIPQIPYKIIEKLAKSNNENLWKALYYDSYDCLDKKNLTFKQKMNLIWKDENDEESYKIFLKPLISSSITKATTQIRINKINIKPIDQYNAIALYEFAIITGEKMAMIDVDNIPTPRIDFIEQQLLEELNGKDLELSGLGIFQFNRELDRESQSRLAISNSKSFFGNTLVMGVTIINLKEDICGRY